jgi:cation transport regulator ChaC
MKDYIFGYGSLINDFSRMRTGQTGEIIPARVSGIRRQWNISSSVSKTTYVGIIKEQGSTCNGVIVFVDEDELRKFDDREKCYNRIKINRNDIESLSSDDVPEGNIWIYVIKESKTCSGSHPIRQSYIDTIIAGCLAIGEDFAREFISTTHGWESPWVNDRLKSSRPETMDIVPELERVERILEEMLPEHLPNRMEAE